MRANLPTRSLGLAALALGTAVFAAAPSAGAANLHETAVARAAKVKPMLYAASLATSTIFVFDQNEKSPASPEYSITSGVDLPEGITTDTSGNLYVTNAGSNSLTIYTPGAVTPIETITVGVNTPLDVAIDNIGDIFVANDPSGQSPYINEYLNGTTTPAFTWYPPNSTSTITGLALVNPNAPGQSAIYATDYWYESGVAHGDVLNCAPGNSSCADVGYSFGRTGGIAVENSPGEPSGPFDFLVADQSVPGIYNVQGGTDISLFSTSYTPWFMAFNSTRRELFVTREGGAVTEYAYPSMKERKSYVASGGFEGPEITGVAVTPAGTFF